MAIERRSALQRFINIRAIRKQPESERIHQSVARGRAEGETPGCEIRVILILKESSIKRQRHGFHDAVEDTGRKAPYGNGLTVENLGGLN